jgi:sulfide:quinone oxidoreductase
MPARVVVLGGGVGGTLAANLLAKELGADSRVTVVDPTGMHVYQPGYLYLALGQANGRWLVRDERTLLRKDVELVVEKAIRVHPDAGTVQLERGGSIDWDYLVISTGARLVSDQVPGLSEGSYEFYSLDGAQRLREALRRFTGGRILLGIAGIPYKCPPAPVEFVFMLEEHLRKRGIRERSEITLLSPLNRAFTIESASKVIQPIMEERGINLTTFFNVESVDPSAHVVSSLEGEKEEYDLLVLVPPHRGQSVVMDSHLGDASGWLPTDRTTLQVESRATTGSSPWATRRTCRSRRAVRPPTSRRRWSRAGSPR